VKPKKEGGFYIVATLIIVILVLLSINNIFFAPELKQDSYVNISQPYEDRLLYARSDYSYGSNYEWDLDGEIVQGMTSTTFLTHFDGSLETTEEEMPRITSENYVETVFDQGFYGKADYLVENNLPLDEGTIELWITLTEPITSEVYSDDRYILRHRNDELDQSFYFIVDNNREALRFNAYYNYTLDTSHPLIGDWTHASQLGGIVPEIEPNVPIHAAITYSLTNNISSLYINGFKTGQGHYFHPFTPVENFSIGNDHVILDEFRIQEKILTAEEIKDNYLRAQPFSNNDIQLNHILASGSAVSLTIETNEDSKIVSEPKFTVSPSEYVLSYRENLEVSITGGTNCRYSNIPKPFSDLASFSESISLPVSTAGYVPLFIKCDGDDYSYYKRYRILPPVHNNFPKTALIFWGNPLSESEIEEVSKYDYLGIAASNVKNTYYLKRVKEENPNLLLAYYTNSIGGKPDYGKSAFNYYDFPLTDEMRLKNADGENIINYGYGVPFYSLYIGNENYHETYADWMKEMYFEKGLFDGIWIDNFNSALYWLSDGQGGFQLVDINQNGSNENVSISEEGAYVQEQLNLGLEKLGNLFRQKIGNDSILLGNNARDLFAAEILNGKFWEGSFKLHDFEYLINPHNGASFAYWKNNPREPITNINCHFQYPYYTLAWERYGLAMSLFFNLYHYNTLYNDHYREIHWMDEYWVDLETGQSTVDPLGKHYLGEPMGEYLEIGGGDVYKKEFDNGIVLLNNDVIPTIIDLNYTYRFINGTGDPIVNKGGFTQGNVSLAIRDGIVLLRALCTDNPSNDPNCIVICGNSACENGETCANCEADCGACSAGNNGNGNSGDNGNENESNNCGNDVCDIDEDCETCQIDCGPCQTTNTTLNPIYLEGGIPTQLETYGGQYDLIINGNHYLISIFSITSDSLTISYEGGTYLVNMNELTKIKFGDPVINIIYSGFSDNLARLTFSKEQTISLTNYNYDDLAYFISFVVLYLIVFISFQLSKKKKY